jgi:hypothetical protein
MPVPVEPPPEPAATESQLEPAVLEPEPAEQSLHEPESAEPIPRELEVVERPAVDRIAASPATVQRAIEEVNHVIDTLRDALDDMEEVLETLELAERQKHADEHEIETLRRSLRQLHRPRDGGHHPPRH